MNVNNRPAQPTNIIKLVSNHTELTIKRFFAPCDGYKISSRFAFFAISDFIIVWDLFLGSSKKILPKTQCDIAYIFYYIHISDNKGFVFYDALTDRSSHLHRKYSTYGSILSIDFDNGTYDLIDSKLLTSAEIYWHFISHPKSDTILFVSMNNTEQWNDSFRLTICRLDASLSKIESQKLVRIVPGHQYFHMIDGTIVFANIRQGNSIIIEHFMYIDDSDNLIEIENTGACLEIDVSHHIIEAEKTSHINDCCWYGTRFFYFYVIRNANNNTSESIAIPLLYVFEMETRRWSKVVLNFSYNYFNYRFGVDSDGFLSLIKYNYESDLEYSSYLSRIALRTPDKLWIMCLFKIRKLELSHKLNSSFFEKINI